MRTMRKMRTTLLLLSLGLLLPFVTADDTADVNLPADPTPTAPPTTIAPPTRAPSTLAPLLLLPSAAAAVVTVAATTAKGDAPTDKPTAAPAHSAPTGGGAQGSPPDAQKSTPGIIAATTKVPTLPTLNPATQAVSTVSSGGGTSGSPSGPVIVGTAVTLETPKGLQPSPTLAPQNLDPQTTAPQTVAPQTAAPQTMAPQTMAPQTPKQQTAAPQSMAPQTPNQQTMAPQTVAPQTPNQQTLAPQTPDHQTLAPQSPTPGRQTPKTPDQPTHAPKTPDLPTQVLQQTNASQTAAPKTPDQQTRAPQTRAPQTLAPETMAPQTKAIPDVMVPTASVPQIPNFGPHCTTTVSVSGPDHVISTSPMSEKHESEEQDMRAVCLRLMDGLTYGTCTMLWSRHDGAIRYDEVDVSAKVKGATANQVYDEILKEKSPPKPGDKTTLIAILASCGALLAMIIGLGIYATHHRKPYHENQQHLTEELHTVENGYHDNPTLEVMEVQPEMQEKKAPLCPDFNDSWIVPMETMNKEVLPDEEDTHL